MWLSGIAVAILSIQRNERRNGLQICSLIAETKRFKKRFQESCPFSTTRLKYTTYCSFTKFSEMSEILKFIPELPIDSWWTYAVALIGLVIAITLAIRFVSSTTDDIDPVEIDRQMLSSVQELTRTGEITDDEYRSIKGQLVERLKTQEEERKKAEEAKSSKSPSLSLLDEIQQLDQTNPAIPQNLTDSDSDFAKPSISN